MSTQQIKEMVDDILMTARAMRESQKRYYSTRDRGDLQMAISREHEFDAKIAFVQNKIKLWEQENVA